MRGLLLIGLLTPVAFAAPVPKDKSKDAEAIVGRWKLIDVQLDEDGKRPAADDTGWKTAVYEFRKDGTYTSTGKGTPPVDGKYTIDPATSPKPLDVVGKDGKVVARAVYELDGDTLKLCVGRGADAKRPTALKTDAKTATHLWTFERVKDK